MQFKTLALVFLSAASLAFAAPEQEKRQLNNIPSSLQAEIFSAIPASVISEYLINPAAVTSDFASGPPAWFSKLPGALQTDLLSAVGVLPTATAGGSASGNSAITSGASSMPSNTSGSSQVSSGGSSASSASGSGATAAGSSTSHAGAPAATAGIAMGVAGAAGILGLALIL
ncbi:hypothetical protein Egran_05461 [Elaphomyces granulatus]|uniref:Uncharacterized protein n=1 Tax=Elaphomyces granulatus TaxID=519963 RepID=A0A232LRL6_9EURO|nr:hypothetical protein Egran_05461 [Elaphomyces granulatus]